MLLVHPGTSSASFKFAKDSETSDNTQSMWYSSGGTYVSPLYTGIGQSLPVGTTGDYVFQTKTMVKIGRNFIKMGTACLACQLVDFEKVE